MPAGKHGFPTEKTAFSRTITRHLEESRAYILAKPMDVPLYAITVWQIYGLRRKLDVLWETSASLFFSRHGMGRCRLFVAGHPERGNRFSPREQIMDIGWPPSIAHRGTHTFLPGRPR
jgi:hypothetical protein